MGPVAADSRRNGRTAALGTGSLLGVLVLTGFLGPRAAAPVSAEPEENQIVFAVPAAVPLLRRSHGLDAPLHVTLTDAGVSPSRALVKPGQRVVWTSQAGHALRIVFDAEVSRSMVCDGLVHFSVKGEELRSGELRPGEQARFCELAPGVYPYQVEIDASPGEGAAAPPRPRGVLVVRSD